MYGMFELMNHYIVGTHPFVKGVSMCFGGRGGGGLGHQNMLVGVVGDFFLERGVPTETGQETSNAKQNILIIVYHILSWVVCFYKLLIPDIMKYITLTYDRIFYII